MVGTLEPEQMVPVRLECLGLTVGGLFVPPFCLRAGESICLHVGRSTVPWYDELLPVLTGKVTHPSLHFHGSVRYMERAMPRRRWWGRLHNPSARGWLKEYAQLDPAQADSILAHLCLAPDTKIGRFGGDPRTRLSLEGTLALSPDLMVFDTVGNSLECIHAMFERLLSRPSGMSLAYLKLRHGPGEPCLRGAVCVDLPTQTTAMAVVE